jgi:hypothetical protein
MSRKRRTPAANPSWTPPVVTVVQNETVVDPNASFSVGIVQYPPLESGAGEMPVEVRARIMGLTVEEYEAQRAANTGGGQAGKVYVGPNPLGELVAKSYDMSAEAQERAELVRRLATLENDVALLKVACEKGFTSLHARERETRIKAQEWPKYAASPAEQDAYHAENFRRTEAHNGEQPFDGIGAWVAAGRPGMAA